MKPTLPIQVYRIGSADVEDQVRQAIANVTLSGLNPSKQSIALTRAIAKGNITTEEAVIELTNFYQSS